MDIVKHTQENLIKYENLIDLLKSSNNNKDNLTEIKNAINNIINFNINDIIINYKSQSLYTTILEEFIKTNNYNIINFIYSCYLNEINEILFISNTLELNIVNVLYKNLTYNGIKTDYLLNLIIKFENLDFLSEEYKTEKKINILEYILKIKKDYNISKDFEKRIKVNLKKLYLCKEKEIISYLKSTIEKTKNDFEKINKKNYKSKKSEKILDTLKLFDTLI